MKKSLLFVALATLATSSAFGVVKDPNSYPEYTTGDVTLTCENVWLLDRNHAGDQYTASKVGSASFNKYRTATIYEGVIYVGSSLNYDPTVVDKDGALVDCAGVEKYDLATGDYLGLLKITIKNDEGNLVPLSAQLAGNQIGIDSFGHLWVAPYRSSNANGYQVYQVDMTTGEAKLAANLTMTFDARIDYCDVIGDISGEKANCTIMAAAASKGLEVFYWIRYATDESGKPLAPADQVWDGGWAGGADYKQVDGTYPVGTTWGLAPVAKIVKGSDEETAYDGGLFYIDGFGSTPVLYSSDGTIVDSFENAPTCTPAENGTNGVAEFSLKGKDFLVYSNHQYTGDNGGCEAWVAELGDGQAFTGMQQVWMIPANGMGKTSDGGLRVHCLDKEYITDANGKEGLLLLTYKANNGFGVYRIAEKGFSAGVGTTTVADAANIVVANGVISVSEEASEIAVYTVAGQLVSKVNNVKEIAAPENAGAYVVKAVVNGAPVVKKVIL